MPNLKKFTEEVAGIDVTKELPIKKDQEIHPPHFNHAFLEELGDKGVSRRSFEKWERIMHSHGEGPLEVYYLRYGSFPRVVDVVVYPDSNEQVEVKQIHLSYSFNALQRLVKLANKHDAVLVPYGAGSNVTNALLQDVREKRMIVAVDMSRMSKVKWVDKVNMMACIEAGIPGQDLEKELKNYGVTLGHEPVINSSIAN